MFCWTVIFCFINHNLNSLFYADIFLFKFDIFFRSSYRIKILLLYFSFKLTYFPLSWELWSSIKIFFGVYSVHTYTISITSSSTLPPPSYLSFFIIPLYVVCYTELSTFKKSYENQVQKGFMEKKFNCAIV